MKPRFQFSAVLAALAVLLSMVPGRAGVLELDGLSWVQFGNGDGAIPSGAAPFTLEAWVNPDVHGDNHMTFWGNQAGNEANGFRLRTGGLRHYFWGNDHDENIPDISADTTGPNSDGWHHFAVTWDGSQTTWFQNGNALGTRNAVGVNVADANHRIGSRINAEHFDGYLDEIRIWNVARAGADIMSAFDKEVATDTPNLVAYFKFDAADDYSDATGLGHDGTPMVNATVDAALNAPVTPLDDADGDGLPDDYELGWDAVSDLDALNGLASGPGPGAGTGDFDGDGLSDLQEYSFSVLLDPTNTDTDGDGLSDFEEVDTYSTSPLEADTDGDGRSDSEEVNGADGFVTDPLNPDSDGDTLSDGEEIAAGSDPTDANDPPGPAGFGALCLDGQSFVTFTNDAGLIPSGDEPFTIEAWINPASIPSGGENGGTMTFWGTQGPNNTSNGFRLRGPEGVRHFFWGNDHDENFVDESLNPLNILDDATGPNADGWHHLAISYDQSQTQWYWNGEPLGPPRVVSGVNVADQNHRIGSRINAEFFDGYLDEIRIWNKARSTSEIAENFAVELPPTTAGLVAYWTFTGSYADATGNGHDGTPTGAPVISPFMNAPVEPAAPLVLRIESVGDDLVFSWDSQHGRLYRLRSETDPAANPDPLSWPVFDGNTDIAATPPENSVTAPRPADPTRLFVLEEYKAPPVTALSDDFEGGAGGWVTASEGAAGTEWELGTPSGGLIGPPGANSGSNCFGTNLDGEYGLDAIVTLRSPAIDLTAAGSAQLRYAQFIDTDLVEDFGSIRILDAADNSELAVIEDMIGGIATNWENVTKVIPAAALGKMVRLEFRFVSDDVETYAGWYIDDVEVIVNP